MSNVDLDPRPDTDKKHVSPRGSRSTSKPAKEVNPQSHSEMDPLEACRKNFMDSLSKQKSTEVRVEEAEGNSEKCPKCEAPIEWQGGSGYCPNSHV